jgi:hypothetical protein
MSWWRRLLKRGEMERHLDAELRFHFDGLGQQAPRVVIINQAMAHLLSPHSDPLKEQLIIGRGMRPEYEKDSARQIIGVVGDIRDQSLNRNPRKSESASLSVPSHASSVT